MTTKRNEGVSRRGFIAACGAAAAAVAVPVGVGAGALPKSASIGEQASRARRDASETYRAAWRVAYLEELEQLADAMRPGFQAGEFYSFRGDGDEGGGQRRTENACARHFGLGVTPDEWEEGGVGSGTARMILAVSPHADVTGEGSLYPCDHARESVAWDVIAVARERGWYTPTHDECGDPLEDAS
jgi:hypothetical protein